MGLDVERVDRRYVQVPFRELPGEHLPWKLPEQGHLEVVEVELATGHVGHGDQLHYSYGRTDDATVERVHGENAVSVLWDGALTQSLQVALFDAVGRALEVPVHELLGEQVHGRTPLAWWCLDYPAADWLAECETAIERGYTDVKLKGRPWRDVRGQVELLGDELPEWFHLGIDFNGTLLDADRAIPILRELETHPHVELFETPIPQDDPGNRAVRRAIESPLAQHYDQPDAWTQLAAGYCDGFVLYPAPLDVGGMLRDGAVADVAGYPSWLQFLGSGITAAFALHLGGVIEEVTWPAVTCHELYAEDLLVESIDVEDGYAAVPDAPGLGYEVDTDAIEAYEIDPPEETPDPPRLFESDWPDGPTVYTSSRRQLMAAARADELPYFERGVRTRQVPRDEPGWEALHERALEAPVFEG